jgi:hypothetical protein
VGAWREHDKEQQEAREERERVRGKGE